MNFGILFPLHQLEKIYYALGASSEYFVQNFSITYVEYHYSNYVLFVLLLGIGTILGRRIKMYAVKNSTDRASTKDVLTHYKPINVSAPTATYLLVTCWLRISCSTF